MEGVHGTTNARSADAAEKKKIEKAGQEFEGVLLNTLLAGLERTFSQLPGGSQSQESEAYSGLAIQQVAGELARNGGIGLGKMVAEALEKTRKGVTRAVPELGLKDF